jgi:hypothetical protein
LLRASNYVVGTTPSSGGERILENAGSDAKKFREAAWSDDDRQLGHYWSIGSSDTNSLVKRKLWEGEAIGCFVGIRFG